MRSPKYLFGQRRLLSARLVSIISTLVLLVAIGASNASAANLTITAAFPSFTNSNIGIWKLNGASQLVGSAIRLTPAVAQQNGSAFFKNRISLANKRSFSSYFVLQFSQGSVPPADGIVFTIQTQANDVTSSGGGLGYKGIMPSVGIEFDTWKNTEDGIADPDANHIGLDINGDVHSVQTAPAPGTLANNTWHVWVDYNGATNNLQVRMNTANNRTAAQLVMTATRNLANDIGADAFVGFTGGTGGAYENHDVQSFFFHNDYQPIDTSTNTYTSAAASVALSAVPATIKNNGVQSSMVTAVVRDSNGALMAGQTVTFTTSSGKLNSATAITNANGSASVLLTGRVAGPAVVRGTTQGGAFGTATVQIIPAEQMYFPVIFGCPSPPQPCVLTDK